MTEDELSEAVALVARFYGGPARGMNFDERFAIQRRLLVLGVCLNSPILAPDPTAPEGGSTMAMRTAA